MQETYTFSRALHLMRYGGKVLQSTLVDIKVRVRDDILEFAELGSKKWSRVDGFPGWLIMGSWVEVER